MGMLANEPIDRSRISVVAYKILRSSPLNDTSAPDNRHTINKLNYVKLDDAEEHLEKVQLSLPIDKYSHST